MDALNVCCGTRTFRDERFCFLFGPVSIKIWRSKTEIFYITALLRATGDNGGTLGIELRPMNFWFLLYVKKFHLFRSALKPQNNTVRWVHQLWKTEVGVMFCSDLSKHTIALHCWNLAVEYVRLVLYESKTRPRNSTNRNRKSLKEKPHTNCIMNQVSSGCIFAWSLFAKHLKVVKFLYTLELMRSFLHRTSSSILIAGLNWFRFKLFGNLLNFYYPG